MTEDYIEVSPLRFRQAFFGIIKETDLTEDEYSMYQIFKLGASFMQQFLSIWAMMECDPEAAKNKYNELFGIEESEAGN